MYTSHHINSNDFEKEKYNLKDLKSFNKSNTNKHKQRIAKSVYEGELFLPNSTPISSISTEDDSSIKSMNYEDLISVKSPENDKSFLKSNYSGDYLPLSTDENLYEFIVYKQTKYAISYRTKLSIKFNSYNKSYIRWSSFGPFKSSETLTFSEINMVEDEENDIITLVTKNLKHEFRFVTSADKEYFLSLIKQNNKNK